MYVGIAWSESTLARLRPLHALVAALDRVSWIMGTFLCCWVSIDCVAPIPCRVGGDYQASHARVEEMIGTSNCSSASRDTGGD